MCSNVPDEPPLDFQAFYQQYHRPCLRYAMLHFGDPAAAVETVETTFAELLQSWTDGLTAPSVQRYAHSVLRSANTSRPVATGRDSARSCRPPPSPRCVPPPVGNWRYGNPPFASMWR
ncbi:hypothetical protein SANT12839_097000 [Streptomyces antimycoticus]|uniref:Uncharacterized protein n=1 Tax=Streptomyces antimycoticus TaxID=68175 RepID=A0A4D4KQU2_9ACTN|nr:hypothetical protein [Streptomyces antimycoticus]GDY48818.1 hypothetical protein SANT12839_097000 [Streptomyces antimycoticus]